MPTNSLVTHTSIRYEYCFVAGTLGTALHTHSTKRGRTNAYSNTASKYTYIAGRSVHLFIDHLFCPYLGGSASNWVTLG